MIFKQNWKQNIIHWLYIYFNLQNHPTFNLEGGRKCFVGLSILLVYEVVRYGRVEWFSMKKILRNCFRTQFPKLHFEMLLFKLAKGLAEPQKMLPVTLESAIKLFLKTFSDSVPEGISSLIFFKANKNTVKRN